MSKKPVIVFEGIEASGKSHHILNVTKYLKKKKLAYIKLREPGGNSNSEKIRKLILNNKSNFDRNTDLLLYLAARNENMSLLKKNYKKKIILIDRFVDSTIAYQHYGFGVDIKFINFINKYLLKKFKVDFTFLNIVNNKNMMKRLKIRKKLNRYDKFNNQFYTNVQNGFIKLAKKNMNRYKIINSNLDIKSNEDQVIQKINQLI